MSAPQSPTYPWSPSRDLLSTPLKRSSFSHRRSSDASPSRHKMLSSPGRPASQGLRTYLLTFIFVTTFFFFLQSFNIGPKNLGQSTRNSLQRLQHYAPKTWNDRKGGHIMKASAWFGENRFYEGALSSHNVHNELHGYSMKVLRERITNGYSTKPAFMLSLIVNELAKPAEERQEWIVWMGPDVVLMNPQIPLEVFLPPADFKHIHFLGTHDSEGLNLGVYFLRVHQWSARMLLDVLAYPPDWLGNAAEKDEAAFEMVVTSDGYREHVQYQPRRWYNAYQVTPDKSEAHEGDLVLHFHDLEGDKWSSMSSTLDSVLAGTQSGQLSLEATGYGEEVAAYWQRLRVATDILSRSEPYLKNEEILNHVRRMQYASTYEGDDVEVMDDAIDNLSAALDAQTADSTPA